MIVAEDSAMEQFVVVPVWFSTNNVVEDVLILPFDKTIYRRSVMAVGRSGTVGYPFCSRSHSSY